MPLIIILFAAPQRAFAQTCPTVAASQEAVCNFEELGFSVASIGHLDGASIQIAESFTTGAATNGYNLQEVRIISAAFTSRVGAPGNFVVAIHDQASSGVGVQIGTLSGDNPVAVARTFAYTTSGIQLDANTEYFIVLSAPNAPTSGDNYYNAGIVSSTAQAGSDGWSIHDKLYAKSGAADFAESPDNFSLHIAIIADVNPATPTASSDATLSDLSLSGVMLTPEFTSSNMSYSASVGNDVDSTTITATATDSANATIAYDTPDDTDGDTADADVELIEGENTITVTVTAEDGTTNDYTITVTRAAPDAPDAPDAPTLPTLTIAADAATFTEGTNAMADFTVSSDQP
ncbi:MAG: choice-of-anchor R domain-containing protein, partial [bacterium]